MSAKKITSFDTFMIVDDRSTIRCYEKNIGNYKLQVWLGKFEYTRSYPIEDNLSFDKYIVVGVSITGLDDRVSLSIQEQLKINDLPLENQNAYNDYYYNFTTEQLNRVYVRLYELLDEAGCCNNVNEKPCRCCGRKNDIGAKVCWGFTCGCSNP